MSDLKEIIANALDILKYDGAVQDTLAEFREKWGVIPSLPNICNYPMKKELLR